VNAEFQLEKIQTSIFNTDDSSDHEQLGIIDKQREDNKNLGSTDIFYIDSNNNNQDHDYSLMETSYKALLQLFEDKNLMDNEVIIQYIGENSSTTTSNDQHIMVDDYKTEICIYDNQIPDNGCVDGEEDMNISSTCSEDDEYVEVRQSRRRVKNPSHWKQAERKKRRNAGEEYVSSKGKIVKRKEIKRTRCKCKLKCQEKISDEVKASIFHEYWKCGYKGQRQFVRSNVKIRDKKRNTTCGNSRRQKTYEYVSPTKNNVSQQVCKAFFLGSLGIGEKTVTYTLARMETIGCQVNRGKKT